MTKPQQGWSLVTGEFLTISQFAELERWPTFDGPTPATIEIDDVTIRRLSLKNAYQGPVAVRLESVTAQALTSTCEWLTASIPVFREHIIVPPPFVFELPDGSLLSERAYWSLVCDVVEPALDLVSDYVRSILTTYDYSLDGICDREESVPGEEPLYAYAARRFYDEREFQPLPTTSDLVRFVNLFTDFMASNDLGHEVRQYEQMMRLTTLIRSGLGSKPEWLEPYVRLCAAFEHCNLYEGDGDRPPQQRDRLRAPGVFKLLLEQLIGRDFAPEYLPLPHGDSDYARSDYQGAVECCVADVIACLYGTDPAQDDVFDWVQERTGLDIRPDPTAYHQYQRDSLAETDRALASGVFGCATNGFHSFDPETRRWQQLKL